MWVYGNYPKIKLFIILKCNGIEVKTLCNGGNYKVLMVDKWCGPPFQKKTSTCLKL